MSAELSQSRVASPVCAADIDEAARRIADVVARTPLEHSDRLSAITGAQVYLKREDLQSVRSYKLRGAYNLLMQLTDTELRAGVVCSSAGNHAQGFALACRHMQVHGRVYVPARTPRQKRDRISYHGAEFIEVIVGGASYDEAAAAALDDVARTGATLVPPYDDPRTMAGQGTIAVEILDQLSGEPDLVVVGVGGQEAFVERCGRDHSDRENRAAEGAESSGGESGEEGEGDDQQNGIRPDRHPENAVSQSVAGVVAVNFSKTPEIPSEAGTPMHLAAIGRVVHIGEAHAPLAVLAQFFRMAVPDIAVESDLQKRHG